MESNFINENVGLFYAKDTYENILLINEINNTNRSIEFSCPICGTSVNPRAIHSDKVSPHFYHINATEHDSESILHWWYKNEYLITGDKFSLLIDGKTIEYTCKTIETENRYNTSLGDYIPDVVITTTNGEEIFFEYNYTNKKSSDDYAEKWLELGNTVIEINIKTLMCKEEKVFKPMFCDGVIFCKTKSERYNIIERHINDLKITNRMRIKYLNGFLRDCMRYNAKEIGIEDLSIIISSMNKQDLLYLPKILGKLKCNTILNDYGQHVFNIANQILKEELEHNKLDYEEYSWFIDVGYSQKWTKCRGARFDNTLYIHKSTYFKDRFYYYRTVIGFDVLLIDFDCIRNEIVSNINNEKERMEDLRLKKMREHMKHRRYEMLSAIRERIDSLNIKEYNISPTIIQHKEYLNISEHVDIQSEIMKYKGVGRYNQIEILALEVCSRLNRIKDYNIKCHNAVNLLEDNSSIINKYCSGLLNFDVIAVFPRKESYKMSTVISICNTNNDTFFEIDIKDVVADDGILINNSGELLENVKNEIYKQFNKLNALESVKSYIDRNCKKKYYEISCNTRTENDEISICFLRGSKQVKCSIKITNDCFTLKYSDNEHRVKLNNLLEAINMVRYIYIKLNL